MPVNILIDSSRSDGIFKHRILKSFLCMLGVYSALFLLARIAFFIVFYPKIGQCCDIGAAIYSFYIGFRLDVTLCAIALCPPFLFLYGLNLAGVDMPMLKKIAKTYILLFNLAALTLLVAEFPLYNETLTKMNPSALMFFKWPLYMMGQILGATHALRLIPFLLLLLFFSGKWSLELADYLFDSYENPQKGAALSLVLSALITLVLLYGNSRLAPLPPSTAFFSSSNFLNQTAANGVYNTVYLLTLARLGGAVHRAEDIPALAKEVSGYFNYGEDAPDDIFKFKKHAARPNIVLIMMESFSAYVGALGANPSLSPRFDELSKKGVFFTSFYANSIGSGRALISTLSSFPFPPVVDDLSQVKAPSVAGYLKPYGYKSYFFCITGKEENIMAYLLHNGFDMAYDEDGLAKKNHNAKPRFDDELFDNADKILRQTREPFLAVIFTATNHNSSYAPPKLSGTAPMDKKSSSFVYADWALNRYMENARNSSYYKNTVFVMLADHSPRFLPGDEFRSERFRIPLLFYSPLIINPHIETRTASQMDIAMTLLRICDIPLKMKDTSFFGTSLFERVRAPFAYFANETMFFYGVALPEGSFIQNLSVEEAGPSGGGTAYGSAKPQWQKPLRCADALLRLTKQFYFTNTILQWKKYKATKS